METSKGCFTWNSFLGSNRVTHHLWVCKFRNSLNVLKQAPRQCFVVMDQLFIQTLHFVRNPADDCVYFRNDAGQLLIIEFFCGLYYYCVKLLSDTKGHKI